RWRYAEEKLRAHNGSSSLAAVVEGVFHPLRFVDSVFDPARAAEYVNQILVFDGYEIAKSGNTFRVRYKKGHHVALANPLGAPETLSHVFIDEQIEKCDRKLEDGDFGGVITNARSLLEAVLIALEGKLGGSGEAYDGDLLHLYKRVQKLLNLD